MRLTSFLHGLILWSAHSNCYSVFLFLFFLPCFLLTRIPPTASPILLGSGALSLEPLRHWEEAVAHRHRDQSHDLWPLPDSPEAQHRRAQGKGSNPLVGLTSACRWKNVPEHILCSRPRDAEFQADVWRQNSSRAPIQAGMSYSDSAWALFITAAENRTGQNHSIKTQRDFCQRDTRSFSSTSEGFKIPSRIWLTGKILSQAPRKNTSLGDAAHCFLD